MALMMESSVCRGRMSALLLKFTAPWQNNYHRWEDGSSVMEEKANMGREM